LTPALALESRDLVTLRIAGAKWRLTRFPIVEPIPDTAPRARLLSNVKLSSNVVVDVRAINILKEALVEAGFTYDSSIFPIRHDVYGIPDAPRSPFRLSTPSGSLVEFPITTFRLGGGPNFPVGGGGYLRLLPFWYTRLGFQRAKADNLPLIAYVHPWEVDPGQPRLAGRARSRIRHYTNLARMYDRLGALLELGDFTSFAKSGLVDAAPANDYLSRAIS